MATYNKFECFVGDLGDKVHDLDEAGDWMDKLLIDGDEVPSTRYIITVEDRWDK